MLLKDQTQVKFIDTLNCEMFKAKIAFFVGLDEEGVFKGVA